MGNLARITATSSFRLAGNKNKAISHSLNRLLYVELENAISVICTLDERASILVRDKAIFSSDRMLRTDYYRKGLAEKKIFGRESLRANRQDELVSGKRPVVK